MTVVEELVAVTLVLLGLSRRNESWVGGWVGGVSIIIYTCPSALLFSSLIFNQAMAVVGGCVASYMSLFDACLSLLSTL